MKQIELRSLHLENFKSFSEPTTVDFDGLEGLVLISGDNRVEPRLGANGAGKSTLWDALCFALYGVSVRGVRATDLVTAGARNTSVGAVLRVNGKDVELLRSGPPLRVSIDGRPAEQADVDRLVGLSRTRWLNSVVFGQGAPLFIDLPVPQRGELLDEVLDLQLWMRAADRAGKAHSSCQQKLNTLRVEVGRTEGSLEALEPLADLKAAEANWEEDFAQRIEGLIQAFEEKEKELEGYPEKEAPKPKADALLKRLDALRALESEASRQAAIAGHDASSKANQIVEFEEAGDICPVCSQKITPAFAKKHLAELNSLRETLSITVEEADTTLRKARSSRIETQTKWEEANRQDKEAAREHASYREARLFIQREMAQLEKQLETTSKEKNPFTARRQKVVEDRKRLNTLLKEQKEEEKALVGDMAALDFWRQGFRRVRLFCLRRVLTELEVETMNAASSLGLIGWNIAYTTETETKSGTSKMGVQIEVTSPTLSGSFNAWSGGEGQRVRLCIALGLAGMIQRWAGVRWNLEVFDEPTNWLSEAGIEDLLELLQDRTDVIGKTIFLCDHRALTFAGFSKVLTVVKDGEGSRIQ